MKYNFIMIWLMMSSSGIGQASFTLRQAIDYGIKNHINMKLQTLEEQDAAYQVREYKSLGIPNINGGLKYNYYIKPPTQPVQDFITPAVYGVLFKENVPLQSTEVPPVQTFDLSFSQKNNFSGYIDASALLFDASYLQGLKAVTLFKKLTANRAEIKKEVIAGNITKAYLAVLIALENKIIIQDNIKNLDNILFETKALYTNGFAEQLDVDRLSYSKENLENELENLSQLILLSQNVLKYQMYYPLFDDIVLTEDLSRIISIISIEDIDLSDSINIAERPELTVFENSISLDSMDLSRIKKSYLPSLVAIAHVEESLQRNNLFDGDESGFLPTVLVGLSMTFPIYDGGNRSARTQRAKIKIDKQWIQKSEFERGTVFSVYNAKISFINAKNTLANRKKGLDLAQKIYDKTQIKFTEGVGSSLEVSQAETALYQSQGQYINALYELLLAKTQLEIGYGRIDKLGSDNN